MSAAFAKDIHEYITHRLSRELDLVRQKLPKHTNYIYDVELALCAMWAYKSIAALRCFRTRLDTTSILDLSVDGNGRIGEMRPETPEAARAGRFIKWQDVEFVIFPPANGRTRITAQITFKWLKSHPMDSSVWKGIIVELLPPHLAFQDSCRLLLLLGLMDH